MSICACLTSSNLYFLNISTLIFPELTFSNNALDASSKTSWYDLLFDALSCSIFSFSDLEILPNSSKPSTKNLIPFSVGNLPEEVWGAYNNPSFCKSANIDLIEAEEMFRPIFFKIVSEPAGSPVSRYDSTTLFSICFDLSLISEYILLVLLQ